jgi:hypothetical protein
LLPSICCFFQALDFCSEKMLNMLSTLASQALLF